MRPLAWAETSDARWCVGTHAALHLTGPDSTTRLGWEQIERADWDRDTLLLTVVEAVGWGEPETAVQVPISEPGMLLELVRERITKSVLIIGSPG